MIIVRRASDRVCVPRSKAAAWLTFDPQDPSEPLAGGFGCLELLGEEYLQPGGTLTPHLPRGAEILTYVHEGSLNFEDSAGTSAIIRTGEFQRMKPERGRGPSMGNASRTLWAHVFQIRLHPLGAGATPGYEHKRFPAGERRGRLCLIASPDGGHGSLRIDQDALIYSAMLERGQHVIHELPPGRGAWLHVVHGEITLDGLLLATGDGVGITAARGVSFTARSDSAVLLLDLGDMPAVLAAPAADPANLVWLRTAAREAEVEAPGAAAAAGLSGAMVFKALWDLLVDVLGSTATATILGRAARRAQPRSPELAGLAITRVGPVFIYALPPSFEEDPGLPAALHTLLSEIRAMLVEQTGNVVIRQFERVPELRGWAI